MLTSFSFSFTSPRSSVSRTKTSTLPTRLPSRLELPANSSTSSSTQDPVISGSPEPNASSPPVMGSQNTILPLPALFQSEFLFCFRRSPKPLDIVLLLRVQLSFSPPSIVNDVTLFISALRLLSISPMDPEMRLDTPRRIRSDSEEAR